MANIVLNHDLDPARWRELIFRGDLLVHSRRESTAALVDHARSMMDAAFGGESASRAQFALSVDDFVRIVGPLKSRFTNDLGTKRLVRSVLSSFGFDLEDTYFDVPRLRVVPHGGYLSAGVSYAYKAHRDTWYSSPTAQLNWWMPVLDVTSDRAMSILPAYWQKAVDNSSGQFDYAQWCAVGRQQAVGQVKEDRRQHPLPLEEIRLDSEIRIAGTRADALVFSAAHLHATAPNESGETRFSLDFRTVSLSDLRAKRGAPNVDSAAKGTTLGDFLRASDFEPLSLSEELAGGVS